MTSSPHIDDGRTPVPIEPGPSAPLPERFRVRVISAGASLNGNVYPAEVLSASATMFDGIRVFVKSDAEHLDARGKDVRNLVGRLTDPVFVTATGSRPAGIEATLDPIDPNDPFVTRIREAVRRGMADLFGLSIDARAQYRTVSGKREVTRFIHIDSVDIIVQPGAGGAVLALTEAFGGIMPIDVKEAVRRIERTNLPKVSRDRLIENIGDTTTDVDLDQAIRAELQFVESVASHLGVDSGGKVSGLGPGSGARVVEAEEDKKARMLDAFFDPNDRSVVSFRECYTAITGDRHVTGRVPTSIRVTEALSMTTFATVLGEALQRAMLADYRDQGIYDVWRDLANIVRVSDFREQHRVRFGGYGDFPVVAEADPYLAVDSPNDEEAVYSVEKRGGLESVTLEMVKNDDVGAIQRIPMRMSRAAKRTLCKFVMDMLVTNPVIYDGAVLFSVARANLGTDALTSASLAAARLAMKKQTEKDSGDRLAIPPRFLWVPDDLEETAVDLFRRNTNTESNFIQSLPIQIRPVWYWTDATDWYLSADKGDIPAVEVGFLDGHEEPQLFVQDDPRGGSVFSNDVITYKLRHVYGGAVTDFRGLYKSAVA